MLQLSKKDKEKVLEGIKNGKIDSADISYPNLIDTIALEMKKLGLMDKLSNSFLDKRDTNQKIPFDLLIGLAVIAKMKLKTSLTDVGFAVTDSELLSELGYNIWDTDRNLENGLFAEGVMRNLVSKYEGEDFIKYYNDYVQKEVLTELSVSPSIHILDCTEITVNLENDRYEKSEVISYDGEPRRGYKLGTIRGLFGDCGIIEEITFGSLKTHDLELCREMLKKTTQFKQGDILINDRGFISREILNYLKSKKGVDTYVPVKKNMTIYKDAVSIAKSNNIWQKHPNKNRKTQQIQFISDLGSMWESEQKEEDVPLNACVVWDNATNAEEEYYVFITTDLTKNAKQIIRTYEIRPEIEEDYRQIKDFWKIEDFKSTKYNFITFHIVMTLIGYMYFQIYKNTEKGSKYFGKSLPVVIKNYKSDKQKSIIIYSGQYFGIFTFIEFINLYAELPCNLRNSLDPVLSLV